MTHEVLPVFLVVVGILCVAAGHIQLVGVVTGKSKAVAVTHGAVVDGVAQAAGLADDGRRTVTAGARPQGSLLEGMIKASAPA